MKIQLKNQIHDYVVYCYSIGYTVEKTYEATVSVFGDKQQKTIDSVIQQSLLSTPTQKSYLRNPLLSGR